jgi:hypothetical protein
MGYYFNRGWRPGDNRSRALVGSSVEEKEEAMAKAFTMMIDEQDVKGKGFEKDIQNLLDSMVGMDDGGKKTQWEDFIRWLREEEGDL